MASVSPTQQRDEQTGLAVWRRQFQWHIALAGLLTLFLLGTALALQRTPTYSSSPYAQFGPTAFALSIVCALFGTAGAAFAHSRGAQSLSVTVLFVLSVLLGLFPLIVYDAPYGAWDNYVHARWITDIAASGHLNFAQNPYPLAHLAGAALTSITGVQTVEVLPVLLPVMLSTRVLFAYAVASRISPATPLPGLAAGLAAIPFDRWALIFSPFAVAMVLLLVLFTLVTARAKPLPVAVGTIVLTPAIVLAHPIAALFGCVALVVAARTLTTSSLTYSKQKFLGGERKAGTAAALMAVLLLIHLLLLTLGWQRHLTAVLTSVFSNFSEPVAAAAASSPALAAHNDEPLVLRALKKLPVLLRLYFPTLLFLALLASSAILLASSRLRARLLPEHRTAGRNPAHRFLMLIALAGIGVFATMDVLYAHTAWLRFLALGLLLGYVPAATGVTMLAHLSKRPRIAALALVTMLSVTHAIWLFPSPTIYNIANFQSTTSQVEGAEWLGAVGSESVLLVEDQTAGLGYAYTGAMNFYWSGQFLRRLVATDDPVVLKAGTLLVLEPRSIALLESDPSRSAAMVMPANLWDGVYSSGRVDVLSLAEDRIVEGGPA